MLTAEERSAKGKAVKQEEIKGYQMMRINNRLEDLQRMISGSELSLRVWQKVRPCSL
jgi:hypothetical protein